MSMQSIQIIKQMEFKVRCRMEAFFGRVKKPGNQGLIIVHSEARLG